MATLRWSIGDHFGFLCRHHLLDGPGPGEIEVWVLSPLTAGAGGAVSLPVLLGIDAADLAAVLAPEVESVNRGRLRAAAGYGRRMGVESGHYRLGPDNARVILGTCREGFGAKAGHDLTIEVTDWSGQVDVPDRGPAAATVSARFELGSIVVWEGAGGARPLTDVDRGEIEKNARRVLGVDANPTAIFESSQVEADDSGGTIRGTLTLGGAVTAVQVRVQNVAPNHYLGTAVVTQSALGVKPYSAFLGALKVRDDVEVHIDADLPQAGSSA